MVSRRAKPISGRADASSGREARTATTPRVRDPDPDLDDAGVAAALVPSSETSCSPVCGSFARRPFRVPPSRLPLPSRPRSEPCGWGLRTAGSLSSRSQASRWRLVDREQAAERRRDLAARAPEESKLGRMRQIGRPPRDRTGHRGVAATPESIRRTRRTGGINAFLVADVRGYTTFTQERGDEAAARLMARFAGIVREHVEARDGSVIELRGDEALAVFRSPRQAIRAAVELQTGLLQATKAAPDHPLPVGIGLDAGEAVPVESGFRGGP